MKASHVVALVVGAAIALGSLAGALILLWHGDADKHVDTLRVLAAMMAMGLLIVIIVLGALLQLGTVVADWIRAWRGKPPP